MHKYCHSYTQYLDVSTKKYAVKKNNVHWKFVSRNFGHCTWSNGKACDMMFKGKMCHTYILEQKGGNTILSHTHSKDH